MQIPGLLKCIKPTRELLLLVGEQKVVMPCTGLKIDIPLTSTFPLFIVGSTKNKFLFLLSCCLQFC